MIIHIFLFIYIYMYIYIYTSIFRKWKIFHQCLLIQQNWKSESIFFIPLYVKTFHQFILLPRNEKNLNDFQYFQMEKKIKYRDWKICLSPQSGKNGVIFFTSLRIWLYFHKVKNISPFPFISMKRKKS